MALTITGGNGTKANPFTYRTKQMASKKSGRLVVKGGRSVPKGVGRGIAKAKMRLAGGRSRGKAGGSGSGS